MLQAEMFDLQKIAICWVGEFLNIPLSMIIWVKSVSGIHPAALSRLLLVRGE
jgi:hypothetical protein